MQGAAQVPKRSPRQTCSRCSAHPRGSGQSQHDYCQQASSGSAPSLAMLMLVSQHSDSIRLQEDMQQARASHNSRLDMARYVPRKRAFGIFGSQGFTPEAATRGAVGSHWQNMSCQAHGLCVSTGSIAVMMSDMSPCPVSDTRARVISPMDTTPARNMKGWPKIPKQSSFLHSE